MSRSVAIGSFLFAALVVGAAEPSLAERFTLVGLARDGVRGVEGLLGATRAIPSPDGDHVYVTGAVANAIAVFRRDPATGALAFVQVVADGVGGVDGLRHVVTAAFSPDGADLYGAGYGEAALAVLRRNPATGTLAFVQVVRGGVDGVEGLEEVTGVVVSPDGAHVYAAGYGDSTVSVFARDPATGALTFLQVLRDGVDGVDGIYEAWAIVLSPDGHHVYVTGEDEDALAVFARNAASGLLSPVEVQRDGVAGVDGLVGPRELAISPDGEHLYVVAYDSHALVVFGRDAVTGTLTFVETQRDGVAGVSGLSNPVTVAVSPDGSRVYMGAEDPTGSAVFARDPATGALTLVASAAGTIGGGNGLRRAAAVVPSPDGRHLHAVGCVAAGCPGGFGHGEAVATYRELATECTPAPRDDGCRVPTAGGSLIRLSDATNDRRDRLVWKWIAGAATPLEAFGDPTATTNDLVLCLYDTSPAAQPTARIAVPAAVARRGVPAWRATTDGHAYRNPDRDPDGATRITLRAGAASVARIKVVAVGLQLPSLPLGAPVTVQLQAANGECWEATYAAPARNADRRFKARSD